MADNEDRKESVSPVRCYVAREWLPVWKRIRRFAFEKELSLSPGVRFLVGLGIGVLKTDGISYRYPPKDEEEIAPKRVTPLLYFTRSDAVIINRFAEANRISFSHAVLVLAEAGLDSLPGEGGENAALSSQ